MTDQEKLSRRQRDRLRHKEEILAAALKLFSDRGFHDVSMQEIATEAEFATGTLYNFFPSKDALFDELLDGSAERITSELAAILGQPGTEVERLSRYFRSLPSQLEMHAPFIKLYVSEVGTRGAKLAKDRDKEEVSAAMALKVQDLLESGIRKGYFRPVDAEVAAIAITSTLETVAFGMAGRFDLAEATRIFEKVEQLFVDGLLLPEGQHHDE